MKNLPAQRRSVSRAMSLALSRLTLASLCTLALCAGAQAQPRPYDIAAGELKKALDAYASQSGVQLIYRIEDVRGRESAGLKRAATPEEALAALLEGTGLQVRRDVSGALVVFTAAPPAPTPPRPEKTSDAGTGTLDTVIVTASRRREPMREVPMQVKLLGSEQLSRQGAKQLQDYLANEAGVDFKSTGGPGFGGLSLRGVSTGNQTIATVGVYVDEVAFGSSTAFGAGPQMALDMAMLDLHHIELLRGPQGTLYGAGAMGGLLKYVTHEPDTYEFSGKLSLGASTTSQGGSGHTVGGVLNVPLKEDVAGLRVSLFREHAGGVVDSVGGVRSRNIDRGDTTGGRVSLLVTPINRLKLRLTATSQKIERGGADFVDYNAATGRPTEGDLTRRLAAPEPYEVKVSLLSADVEYDFGAARLNAITSKQSVRSNLTLDLSAGYVPLLGGLGLNLGSTPAAIAPQVDKTTQEFRLTSRPDKHFEWLAGLYFADEDSNNRQHVESTLASGAPGPQLLTVAMPADYRERALYGNLTWKFDNGLAVTGGLRVARNKQHYNQQIEGLLAGGVPPLQGASSDDSTTWLLTARYALSPTSSAYLRGASGYRPGGPNAVLYDINTGKPTAPPTFRPDGLTSLEAGYKADLLDKRLSVEASVFDIRWRDLQQLMPVNGLSVIVNAGAAEVRGAEMVFSFRPDKQWGFGGNAAWLDAKLTEDAPGLGAKSGERLPASARFSAALNASYSFELAGLASYVGLAQRYVGERLSGFERSTAVPLYRLPAYAMTDLQAGIDFTRASLALYLRNAFDKRAQLGSQSNVQALGGPAWVSVAKPRTFGATLTVPF